MASPENWSSWSVKYDPETMPKKAKELLSKGKSITGVAAHFDVCRDTIYAWRDTHPEFAEAIRAGLNKSQDFYEELAIKGITGEIEKFGGSTLQFILKNRFRDAYSDQQPVANALTAIEQLLKGKD